MINFPAFGSGELKSFGDGNSNIFFSNNERKFSQL